jgi:tetratricopeptide (TPR) repeat protein
VRNSDLKRRVLHGLGEMLLFSGRIDEAKAVATALTDLAKRSGKKNELAWSLILQGHLEQQLGLHANATETLDEAIRLLLELALSLEGEEARHNTSALATCYLNKAVMRREDGNFDEALSYCERAEQQHRTSGDKLDAGKALLFRGEIHCANAEWEKGFECFRSALGQFLDISNPLWMARAAERIARLNATHEHWKEAVEGMLAAAAGAKEAGHAGEQVHFLCVAAELLRQWKISAGKDNVLRQIRKLAKDVPEAEQGTFYAAWTGRMDESNNAVEKAVREDAEARDLLDRAKNIAERAHLHKHLANCLLDEAYQATAEADVEARRALVTQAVELLKQELRSSQSPKTQGELMGRISSLCYELGEKEETMSWLQRAGKTFEKVGDVHGLANFYGSLGEINRMLGRLDEEIDSYRKV